MILYFGGGGGGGIKCSLYLKVDPFMEDSFVILGRKQEVTKVAPFVKIIENHGVVSINIKVSKYLGLL